MTQHLANVHKINIRTHREETKQQKLTDIFLTNEKPLSLTKSKDEKFILARRLVVWFCRDLLPFSTVENEGFHDFWDSLKRGTSLPTRANISNNALDDMYKVLKERLILDLKSSSGNQVHLIENRRDHSVFSAKLYCSKMNRLVFSYCVLITSQSLSYMHFIEILKLIHFNLSIFECILLN